MKLKKICRIERNFGMMRPEGYRKCIRLMKLADKFNIPIIIFVDTPGAYPGVGAEERGQAEAIASTIECCISLSSSFLFFSLYSASTSGITTASHTSVLVATSLPDGS